MAEFAKELKDTITEEAQSIRDFITRDIVDYFWRGDANDSVRRDLNTQLNKAIARLQDLERQTRG